MASEVKNVIVIGAGGNVGTILIPALLDAGFTVSALVRPSTNATFVGNVTVQKADYTDFNALVAAFKGQDAVISTMGTFSAHLQQTAIDAAAVANVKRFIPSEYGGDTSHTDNVSFAPFPKEKRRIVEYLQSKEAEGLTWTAICTGAFVNWLLEHENAAMGWDIRAKKVTIFDTGDQTFDVSTLSHVIQSIVSTLQYPEETKNTYVYVRSFTTTQNKLLATLERISGRKFKVTRANTKDLAERGQEHLKQGDYERGYPEIVTALGYGPWGFLDFKERAEKWNRTLGLKISKEESLDSIIEDVLKKKDVI
ncbi:uncharacterized protein N7473_010816 [Penicillium subrubescens]|uniref:Isoflavone reductase-like protein n=1 Tax=Penicillium subrubescens TaxID=1316194 RepID=A0A1Q5T2J9_9EURO|nr:uncharacterized protein N7473_010816 [Penicillium subrubescens]KAJ5883930.1 hypothetical protein N7473_010816 [Penicillium subrubescens]OKO94460.1 Isoflavone reductase -like protein [Penicillium subrubescens]